MYPKGVWATWGVGSPIHGLPAGVVGVSLYLAWDQTQVGPTTFNWTQLDARIHEATAQGRSVCLMLMDGPSHCPHWVIPNKLIGLMNTNKFQTGFGQVVTGPVFWDAPYLAARVAFIKALGARYAGNPAVVGVTCGALNWQNDDMHVNIYQGNINVHGVIHTLDQPKQWKDAGWGTSVVTTTLFNMIDETAQAFPSQVLKFEAGVTHAMLDPTDYSQAESALAYGYSKYPGRFVGQTNFLSTFKWPDGIGTVFASVAGHPSSHGWQLLSAAVNDPTDGWRLNGGHAAPVQTIFKNALNNGLQYKPLYTEVWGTPDAIAPALASEIQAATVAMQKN